MATQKVNSGSSLRERFNDLFSTPRGRQVGFALIGVVSTVVVVGGGYVLYDQITGLPAPDVKNAPPEKVAEFLGHPKGLARMPIPRRKDFLIKLCQENFEPAKREALATTLNQMTTQEKKVCRDAVFDVFYEEVLDGANDYRRQPTQDDKYEFVDRTLAGVYHLRDYLNGRRGGGRRSGRRSAATGAPTKPLFDKTWSDGLPTDTDGAVKLLISKTKPKDRARMRPFIEDLRQRDEELKDDPRELARIRARYAPEEG